ncbi:hypothetical protein T4B_12850 [Trichinella pseudospiralis]|uniref:Uncharacterized protein n=1 Tax=Trichinella pseudospiralis TaxID=6337 RepID=A0A0V1IP11_TRIPS|nr:hypothetical protein T4B_12850 [Trichinella pseudospiralis]KRZ41013.1 hypothetical protein T4C_11609 [Trichinella pseudospiralis]
MNGLFVGNYYSQLCFGFEKVTKKNKKKKKKKKKLMMMMIMLVIDDGMDEMKSQVDVGRLLALKISMPILAHHHSTLNNSDRGVDNATRWQAPAGRQRRRCATLPLSFPTPLRSVYIKAANSMKKMVLIKQFRKTADMLNNSMIHIIISIVQIFLLNTCLASKEAGIKSCTIHLQQADNIKQL